jgi:methylated-DNA-[protein]-cysteine S-methyltransferase
MNRTYSVTATGWGYVAAVWSTDGLWELTFPQPTAEAALAALHHGEAEAGSSRWTDLLSDELGRYFAGEQVVFSVPVDWSGYTPFQAAVLKYTAGIAYGAVDSYGRVAIAIGSPRAARAVGGALHINRTPVVVPCHRVVGADGSMVGFGGGLPRKEALLALEKENG